MPLGDAGRPRARRPATSRSRPTADRSIASCWGDGRVVRMTLDAAGRPSSPVIARRRRRPVRRRMPLSPVDRGGRHRSRRRRRARCARPPGDEFAHLVPGLRRGSARRRRTDGIRRSPVARAPGGLPPRRTDRDDRHGPRPRAVLARRPPTGLRAGAAGRAAAGHADRGTWCCTRAGTCTSWPSCRARSSCSAPDADGTWRLVGGTPLGAGTLPGDTAAELAASRDGEFLYAGVRGSNTIATLRVRGAGESLAPVALVEAGVDWPRHHVVVRDTLLVAGQLLRRGRLAHARHPHRRAGARAPPRRGAVADLPAAALASG